MIQQKVEYLINLSLTGNQVEKTCPQIIDAIVKNAGKIFDLPYLQREPIEHALMLLIGRITHRPSCQKQAAILADMHAIMCMRNRLSPLGNLFDLLPTELIKKIVVHLGPDQLATLKTVCITRVHLLYESAIPAWIDAQRLAIDKLVFSPFEIDKVLPHLTTYKTKSLPHLNSDLLQIINLPRLKHLHIRTKSLTDREISQFKMLTRLESLTISKNLQEWLDLQGLHSCALLLKLHLKNNYRLIDASLSGLCHLKSLRQLSIKNTPQITDSGLRYLSSLTNLQALRLEACVQIGNLGLKHLQNLTNLQKLSLAYCPKVDDRGLDYLSSLNSLKDLNLTGCNVTDNGLTDVLLTLTQLNSLIYHNA